MLHEKIHYLGIRDSVWLSRYEVFASIHDFGKYENHSNSLNFEVSIKQPSNSYQKNWESYLSKNWIYHNISPVSVRN